MMGGRIRAGILEGSEGRRERVFKILRPRPTSISHPAPDSMGGERMAKAGWKGWAGRNWGRNKG